jgi:hypothetical protein
MSQSRHAPKPEPFLQWLLLIGIIAFGLYVAWQKGFVQFLFSQDISHVSFLIAAIFFAGSVHAAARAWVLTSELRSFERTVNRAPPVAHDSCIVRYLQQIERCNTAHSDRSALLQVMVENLRGTHDVGWYITGLLTKLGLLGTVIGFIMMMQSVGGMEVLDATHAPELIQRMTRGMGVALVTTLLGLLGSIGLGLQFLLLDRSSDRLIAAAVTHAEAGRTPAEQEQ